jgi:hypothetical protein
LKLKQELKQKETTMVIAEVFQYLIRKQAEEIQKLKTEGVIRETVEKYAYISPDGKHFRNSLPPESAISTGWKWGKVKFVKLIGHISPKHPQWKSYKAAKHRASLLLTARRILKLNQDCVPEKRFVREALKKDMLSNHARRGNANALCFRALRYLRKIDNRLAKAPERFVDVERWISDRHNKMSDCN